MALNPFEMMTPWERARYEELERKARRRTERRLQRDEDDEGEAGPAGRRSAQAAGHAGSQAEAPPVEDPCEPSSETALPG